MKKIYTTLLALLAITQISYGQWSGAPGDILYNTGKVGIGVTGVPDTKFDVNSTVAGVARFNTSTTGNTSNIVISNSGNWNYGVIGVVSATGSNNGDVYGLGYISNPNQSFIPALNWTSTGKIGIGTSSPSELLQVNNGSTIRFQASGARGIWVNNEINGGTSSTPGELFLNYGSIANTLLNSNGGNVGIGGIAPTEVFQVNNFSTGAMRFQVSATKGIWVNNEINGGSLSAPGALYLNYTSTANTLLNAVGGYVGIGTTTPKELLSVNGNIRSKQVKVEMTNWPDFVFKSDYQLPSLPDVKAYIEQNQHLPDMPAEDEIIKNGVNLGEMVKLQTKKIEELTLYIIEKDKQFNDQQKQIDELKAQLKAIVNSLPKN